MERGDQWFFPGCKARENESNDDGMEEKGIVCQGTESGCQDQEVQRQE